MPKPPTRPLPFPEFILLLAMMTSIVALATDMMLPALDRIGAELGATNANDAQLVISSMFLVFAVGQIAVGPLSDSFGRKPVIYAGYLVFAAGCLLSMFAAEFTTMLIGRVLQGLGAAGPRIVSMALVRDGYEGRAMARVMSFVMAVFIVAPAIAPALGQAVILAAGWRATFFLPAGDGRHRLFLVCRTPTRNPATRCAPCILANERRIGDCRGLLAPHGRRLYRGGGFHLWRFPRLS